MKSNYIFQPDQYPGSGTFAILNQILAACEFLNELPHVKSPIFYKFFKNPQRPKNGKAFKRQHIGFHSKSSRPNYGGQLIDPTKTQKDTVNHYLEKYFHLKGEVRDKIDDFQLPSNTMGVHIRSKKRYEVHISPIYSISEPPMNEFIELINNSDYENVLICSDNKDIKNEIRTESPNKNIISYTERLKGGGETHRYNKKDMQIVEDAIVEAYLLSKCKYFVHSISNISNFVQFLSPELENYNIIEKYRKQDDELH